MNLAIDQVEASWAECAAKVDIIVDRQEGITR